MWHNYGFDRHSLYNTQSLAVFCSFIFSPALQPLVFININFFPHNSTPISDVDCLGCPVDFVLCGLCSVPICLQGSFNPQTLLLRESTAKSSAVRRTPHSPSPMRLGSDLEGMCTARNVGPMTGVSGRLEPRESAHSCTPPPLESRFSNPRLMAVACAWCLLPKCWREFS